MYLKIEESDGYMYVYCVDHTASFNYCSETFDICNVWNV